MKTEAPAVRRGFLRQAAWIPSATLALFGCTIFAGSVVAAHAVDTLSACSLKVIRLPTLP
jgi:hypothetical protein